MPKRYKVTGSQPVLNDKMPGESFDADLDHGVEDFLLGIGAIKVVSTDVESDKRIQSADDSPKKKPAKRSAKKKG